MAGNQSRREVIRLLSLAGLSLYLPSCSLDETKTTKNTLEIKVDSLLKQDEDKVLNHLASNQVSYFKSIDQEYQELKSGFNLRIVHNPQIIALPKNTKGVAEAVKYANDNNLLITIKSGGHSFEGFSSNDDGMQINLSLLNSIEWLEYNEVKIGPSCKLKEIYDELLPKGRLLPAGSCATVGIGGLTLGGGYGFFSRKYGLTCDSLNSATIVDGNGEVHNTVNGDELMWALKGGGNGNFGVVTEMTFTTKKAPKSFTRHRFKAFKLDGVRARNLLKEWFEYSTKLPKHAFSAFVLNGKTLTLLITHYEEKEEDIEAMINRFTELCDKTSIGKSRPLAKSLETYYGIQHSIYFKNASAGYYQGFHDIENCIDKVIDKVLHTRGVIYQVNTLGGNILTKEYEEASCYPHRSFTFLSELQTYWEEGQDSTKFLAVFEEIQTLFYDNGIRRQYRNYPDVNFKNEQEAYYGANNLQRLREIKHKYDPSNRIQHPQSISVENS